MKTFNRGNQLFRNSIVMSARSLLVAGFLFLPAKGWAQSTPLPVLTITPAVSNQLVITITNGVNTVNYDLYWIPALANPAVSWKAVTNGAEGQTNFTVSMGVWQSQFYQVVVDTNYLWKAADPNNPAEGALAVFIDSPTNGSNLTQ
jgi:hypothetical protein